MSRKGMMNIWRYYAERAKAYDSRHLDRLIGSFDPARQSQEELRSKTGKIKIVIEKIRVAAGLPAQIVVDSLGRSVYD